MRNSLLIVLALAAPLAFCSDSAELPVKISPDSKSIRYIGRFEKKDPAKYRFQWAGSSFEFRFEGKACNLLMQDECGGGPNPGGGNTNNYFTVVIDKTTLELSLEKGRTVYRIGDGLEDGAHTVTVFRRTCPRFDPVKFMGLQLEAGKALLDPAPARKRCIEVIGDSISVGYGIMGEKADSPANPLNENCYLTYGAVTARELDADFVCIAWSGFGVCCDHRGNRENAMITLYDRTVPGDKESKWSFEGYTPDAVVINLGTNDFSAKPPPDRAEFNKGYRALLEQIWSHAPKAHVFCVAGGMIGTPQVNTIKENLTELFAELAKEGKKNVSFTALPHMDTVPNGRAGQHHPGVKAQRAMADVLIPEIKKDMGW